MYKRKGCGLWTIEESDCSNFTMSMVFNYITKENTEGFLITDLVFNKEVDLFEQIDLIAEFHGKKYLGYLEKCEIKDYNKDCKVIPLCLFTICQKDYLKDVEIIKEKVYNIGDYE